MAVIFTWAVPVRADHCPAPIVAYSLVLDGQDSETAAKVGQFTGGRIGALANHLVNRIILENSGRIRWSSSAFGPEDADFSLVVTENSGANAHTLSYRITDQKGRQILAPQGVNISRDDFEIEHFEALTDSLASTAQPLFPKLRAHQIRIRETENSAIHAELSFTPQRFNIAPGENLPLTARLADCDSDHPPLPDRPVQFTLLGPGKLDPQKSTTDAAGEIAINYDAINRGEALVNGFWAYTNTSGNQTLSDGSPAVITIAGLQITQIGISPQYYDDVSADERYLASLWLLSDVLIETFHPNRGIPSLKRQQSPLCPATVTIPTYQVLPGARQRWHPKGETGNQSAWADIIADLTDPRTAILRFRSGAYGAPEPGWEEEHGSEITSVISVDFLIDIKNPESQSFDLELTPTQVVAEAKGASDYGVVILLLGATGCRGPYKKIRYSLNTFSQEFDQSMDKSSGPIRLRVEGEKHLQVAMRFTGIANAWGGIMEPPYDGSALIDVELTFRIAPVPSE